MKTTHIRARVAKWAAVAAAVISVTAVGGQEAGAAGVGVNAVKTAHDQHAQVGMGPGWVLLSYKANGPMVGYLFAKGFTFADGTKATGSDRIDVRGIADGATNEQGLHVWPWGYADGAFDGCAYVYGTRKLDLIRPGHSSEHCANGPSYRGWSTRPGTPDKLSWWHSEHVFCYTGDRGRTDSLCNKYGVWSENKGGALGQTTPRSDCRVYANIGADAVYGSTAPAQPRGLLAVVPTHDPVSGAPTTIDVRYVTKDRQWVMAKWRGHPLTRGNIAWGFFPRTCLN